MEKNSWFTQNLGDAMLAGNALDRIRASFADELFADEDEQAGRADERAVFVRHESEGRLHCEVRVYFSPAAACLAEALGASPCNPPSRDGLSLLAGREEAWSALFA